MKKYIPLLIFFLLISGVLGLSSDMRVGSIMKDSNYTYTVNTNFSLDTLEVDYNELYFNTIPYCDSVFRNYITSDRSCPSPAVSPGGGQKPWYDHINATIEPPERDYVDILWILIILLVVGFIIYGVVIYSLWKRDQR